MTKPTMAPPAEPAAERELAVLRQSEQRLRATFEHAVLQIMKGYGGAVGAKPTREIKITRQILQAVEALGGSALRKTVLDEVKRRRIGVSSKPAG